MRPDESRFHMLLGRRDWQTSSLSQGETETPLADLWEPQAGGPLLDRPYWDERRSALTLPEDTSLPPATKGEGTLSLATRRAAAADANGNIYWIGDDALRLYVRSAGNGRSGPFWPDPRAGKRPPDLFLPAAPPPPAERRYTALAATAEGWLIAAFEEPGGGGLSQFDLVGGGAPSDRYWPQGAGIRALDLAAGCCGGLWLLDGAKRLFELDRALGLVGLAPGAPEADLFQPLGEASRSRAASRPALGRDLSEIDEAIDPIALEALPGGVVALLSRQGESGRIFILRPDGTTLTMPLPDGFVPHDMALGAATLRDGSSGSRLAVTGGSGNQALSFGIAGEGATLTLASLPEAFPLRRYGGRALVPVLGILNYDSGPNPNWMPLVERPRLRFAETVTFVTRVFDGVIPQTVWDRIRLDGCIPPGTAVRIEARAADEKDTGAGLSGEWFAQPPLVLNPNGSEFAGYGPSAVPATDLAKGKGSWELLLQRIRGRFAQLRITLSGDGGDSPHLRALRLWYPRQSWSERYLPAVYRSDPEPADFLERFLANMEGTVTVIERRIADAQFLFDPRSAPVETLEWLASWFDVALDPAWDEQRRRLFIAHAVTFFAMRGTVRGVETALALAFDECVDERLFTDPEPEGSGIRIVESFLTRRPGVLAAPDGARFWTPAEGNAGLADRLARARGLASASAGDRALPVPLYAPAGADPAVWAAEMAAALGFVPEAAAGERQRWRQYQLSLGRSAAAADLPRGGVAGGQRSHWTGFAALASRQRGLWQQFLHGRYARLAALNSAHAAAWTSFAEVSLPDRLPATPAGQEDWRSFEADILPTDSAAHRFSVLLPVATVVTDSAALARQEALARRIVELEKPAHTVFDVRFYFAMNRIGEARLGLDTTLGQGSRAPELLPPAILGRAYLGESFVGPEGPFDSDGRKRLAC
ncbi:MAG TPA: phage tail protein [Allosphingosinicella sp.]|jgi:phage tail-like protein